MRAPANTSIVIPGCDTSAYSPAIVQIQPLRS